jgi:hypothetical protein
LDRLTKNQINDVEFLILKPKEKIMACVRNAILTTAAALLCANAVALAESSMDATKLDPQADALLKKMSDYVGGLKSFTFVAHVSDEHIMSDGFKLSMIRSAAVKVQRPDKLHVARKGMLQDVEVFFDGRKLVVHGKRIGRSIEVPVSGDIDAALDATTETFGAELPARDLLSTDSYTPLMEPVEESVYLGTVEIDGTTCRHLAFRTEEVDWQLWVAEGDQPLPCRYTITSKWTYGAPQYTLVFTNWEVDPELPASAFQFAAPDGVKSVTVEEFRKLFKQTEDTQ